MLSAPFGCLVRLVFDLGYSRAGTYPAVSNLNTFNNSIYCNLRCEDTYPQTHAVSDQRRRKADASPLFSRHLAGGVSPI